MGFSQLVLLISSLAHSIPLSAISSQILHPQLFSTLLVPLILLHLYALALPQIIPLCFCQDGAKWTKSLKDLGKHLCRAECLYFTVISFFLTADISAGSFFASGQQGHWFILQQRGKAAELPFLLAQHGMCSMPCISPLFPSAT